MSWRTAGRKRSRVVARAYDKGIESGSHAPGERIRLEDQRRWAVGHRRGIEELDAATVAATFAKRFDALRRAAEGITVTGAAGVAEKLREAVRDGEITAGEAVDVAGYLLLEANGGAVGHRQTRWRHRRIAERVGLILVPGPEGLEDPDDVILAEQLAEAFEPGVWIESAHELDAE